MEAMKQKILRKLHYCANCKLILKQNITTIRQLVKNSK